MAILTHNPKEEKPDLLYYNIMESLRNSYQESYDEEDMTINKEILTDFMNDIKLRLKNRELSKQTKARLINLLDRFQDLHEAQSDRSTFDVIETAEGMTYKEYIKTTPAWRLHKKFQSSLETKVTSSTGSK